MENLRDILYEQNKKRAEKRGSLFVTVLIIFIFALGGVFYLKTSKPDIYNAAVECIKTVGNKAIESVKTKQAPQQQSAPVKTQPTGEMLRSAETFDFEYLAPCLVSRFENDSFTVMPVKDAVVTSDFGSRTDPVTKKTNAGHHGIDLAAKAGSAIYAYDSGEVTDAGTNEIYGNYILLDSGATQSFYGHMSELLVDIGDKVSAGEKIGVIGSTGKSTGIHLHFEIRVGGERVDPTPYLYEKI